MLYKNCFEYKVSIDNNITLSNRYRASELSLPTACYHQVFLIGSDFLHLNYIRSIFKDSEHIVTANNSLEVYDKIKGLLNNSYALCGSSILTIFI